MATLKPTDIIAAILIICCTALIITGHNSFIEWLLLAIAGSYGLIKVPWKSIRRK